MLKRNFCEVKQYFGRFFIAGAFLFISVDASALGLGELKVHSNLEQPLNGTIVLNNTLDENLQTIKASIAGRKEYQILNIAYPDYIKDIELLVEETPAGGVIRLKTKKTLNEPFIHLLVKLDWPNGGVLREYTALIDPPMYVDDKLRVNNLSQVKQTKQRPTAPAPKENVATQIARSSFSTTQNPTSSSGQAGGSSSGEYGPVGKGETLGKIAASLQKQFPQYTSYQIMQLLFEENRAAFINDNINGLKAGSILRISDLNQIGKNSAEQSRAFFRQQMAGWGSGGSAAPREVKIASSGSSQAKRSTGQSEGASSGGKELFQIGAKDTSSSYISASGGNSDSGDVIALQEKLANLESRLSSKEIENGELSSKIQLLEAQLADMNRLSEMAVESTEMAQLESNLAQQNNKKDADAKAGAKADEPAQSEILIDEILQEDADSVVEAAEQEQPATENVETQDKITLGSQESVFDSIKNKVLEEGWWKAIAGIFGLIFAVILFVFVRKRKSEADYAESLLSVDGASSMSYSQSRGDDKREPSFLSVYNDDISQADDVDPIAEADVYIAYGRDAQAVDVLKESIEMHPERADIKYKLLGLYHAKENRSGFEQVSTQLYKHQGEGLTQEMWDDICKKAKELNFEEDMFNTAFDELSDQESVDDVSSVDNSSIAVSSVDLDSVSEFQDKNETPKERAFKGSVDEEDNLDGADLTPLDLDDGRFEFNNDDIIAFDKEESQDSEGEKIEVQGGNNIHLEDNLESPSLTIMIGDEDDETVSLMGFDDGISEIDSVKFEGIQADGDDAENDVSAAESGSSVAESQDISLDEKDADSDVIAFESDYQPEADVNVNEELDDPVETLDANEAQEADEANTKLELAKVFVDLGDADGAKKVLNEIIEDNSNSEETIAQAKSILSDLEK